RRQLQFLTILTLFVPLPLFASAWQAALGTGGWLPVAFWRTPPPPDDPDLTPAGLFWKPWAQGLGAAIWVHAVAGLPWVILLVGQGLCWVERELEEDALTAAGPWRVLWAVTLRRSRLAIAAAGLWIGLLAATEITVTDMMQVRTFAEEVYYQFVVGDDAGVARALAVSVPLLVLIGALVIVTGRRWDRAVPPPATLSVQPRLFPVGRWRWPLLVGALLVVGLLIAVPLVSLVWKAGLAGRPPTWHVSVVLSNLEKVRRTSGVMIAESLAVAAGTGTVA